ncbi:MAG TPA: tagaturonate reductase, partial [Gemmataceae bacterium]|nr:tagaturonate reductase [Gemmataceae bacterium]
MASLPETVLQFGAGNFLRAFADLFVHQANEEGQNVGRIVVVQSTGGGRADLLNRQGGRYHVVVRGLENGQVVDRVEECSSISRALVADRQWGDVLDVAASPTLRFILSNTTEAGYAVDASDAATPPRADAPGSPRSFPAKLTAVLFKRWQARQLGVTIMPCELIEDNAVKLRALVLQLASAWTLPAEFTRCVEADCVWLSSLVDRIVPGPPADHPLLSRDPLVLMAEPFAFWALEAKPHAARWAEHPAILRTTDVKPYFLRKVRILNGAHTALVAKVGLKRFETVREALDDEATRTWLERLLFEEIVPTLEGRVDSPEQFARQTIERFRNPFLRHRLETIAVNQAEKREIRLVPTYKEFREKFGRVPPLLHEVLDRPVR